MAAALALGWCEMSKDRAMPESYTRTLPGDWWMLGTAFLHFAAQLPGDWQLPDYHPDPRLWGGPAGGITIEVKSDGAILGEAIFTGNNGETTITVEPASLDSVPYWARAIECLQTFADDVQRTLQLLQPGTDVVIERYYRSRAVGSRKTLRQIAAETGYSYDYLRKVKRQYDADGKWGSKKN